MYRRISLWICIQDYIRAVEMNVLYRQNTTTAASYLSA